MEAVHISERLPGVLAGLLDRINEARTPGEVQIYADEALPAEWFEREPPRSVLAARRDDGGPKVRRVGA